MLDLLLAFVVSDFYVCTTLVSLFVSMLIMGYTDKMSESFLSDLLDLLALSVFWPIPVVVGAAYLVGRKFNV